MSRNLSEFILQRLYNLGVRTIFGVPGDFVMHFLDHINQSPDMVFVPCCNELNAAYMADGYARVNPNGVGCICVTTGVGALSAMNGISLSYAENVPMVIISGNPFVQDTEKARSGRVLLHHTTGTSTSLTYEATAFSPICCAIASLSTSPLENCLKIDSAFQRCVCERRPVLVQLPVDLVTMPLLQPMIPPSLLADKNFRRDAKIIDNTLVDSSEAERQSQEPPRAAMEKEMPTKRGEPADFEEAIQAVTKLVMENGRGVGKQAIPTEQGGVILYIGVELQKYFEPNDEVRRDLLHLIDNCRIPFATALLGRSILSEQHPLYLGSFNGPVNPDPTNITDFFASAGAIISLGADFIDTDMSDNYQDNRWAILKRRKLSLGTDKTFQNVPLGLFIHRLGEVLPPLMSRTPSPPSLPRGLGVPWNAEQRRMMERAVRTAMEADKDRTGRRFFEREIDEEIKQAQMKERTEQLVTGAMEREKEEQGVRGSEALEKIMAAIPENAIVVSDTGDLFFRLHSFRLPSLSTSISCSFYKSIGYALPAAIGAYFAELDRVSSLSSPYPSPSAYSSLPTVSGTTALPAPSPSPQPPRFHTPTPQQKAALRPIVVLTGDGALQMTIQEMSTLFRHSARIMVVVWNNSEYLIEKALHPQGLCYNDIARWNYSLAPSFFAPGEEFASSAVSGHITNDEQLTKFLDGLSTKVVGGLKQVHVVQPRKGVSRVNIDGPIVMDVVVKKGDMDVQMKVWGIAIATKMEEFMDKINTLCIKRNQFALLESEQKRERREAGYEQRGKAIQQLEEEEKRVTPEEEEARGIFRPL